ncbi:GTPase [Corynebacterium sp. 335C]
MSAPVNGARPDAPMDPVSKLFHQCLDALAAGGHDLPDHAARLRSILESPPRVVIVGRLKAGKSTLVNALTGSKVAATASLECTNAVAVYRNGSPARAEVVGLDGRRERRDLVGGMLTDLGRPAEEVAYVDRFLPSRALEGISLIDTPGLATLTTANADATGRALIDGYDQTRGASVDADAVVFLFDTAPRRDELDFLGRLGFTPLNAVGVLSRADGFGEGAMGAADPLDAAAAHCAGMSRDLASSVRRVVPLAGLLAESARGGQVTQAVARTLTALGSLDRWDLLEELEAERPTRVPAAERDAALDLLGEYGVIHGAAVARDRGAVGLAEWLTERSGIVELEHVLHDDVMPHAALHRAGRILEGLDRLAYSHPGRDHIRQVIHILTSQPLLRNVLLHRSFRGLLASAPQSPLIPAVADLLHSGSPARRLGLTVGASPEEVRARHAELIAWLQGMAMGVLSAAEEDARVLSLGILDAMRPDLP